MMSMVSDIYPRVFLICMAVYVAVYAQSIMAEERRSGTKHQSGFSEFTPPVDYTDDLSSVRVKQWSNGRSFNDENKVRFSTPPSKNPWKPVNSRYYKKTFSGQQRPWGNVPDRKPGASNMRLHDQRFKQWSHEADSGYRNMKRYVESSALYGQSLYPFSAYGYPGLRNNMFFTPTIYPSSGVGMPGYGAYPGGVYPFTSLSPRPFIW